MLHGSAVDWCMLLVVAATGTAIAASILKASVALYNLLAGALAKPSSTPISHAPANLSETRITSEPGSVLALKDDWAHRPKIETPLSVPKPSFEWAMCIVLVVALVSVLVEFLVLRVLRFTGMAAGLDALRSWPIDLILCLLNFFIHSGINAAMLPSSFGKGVLISLICLFLGALIASVFFVVLVLVALIFGPDVIRFGL